MCVWVAQSTFYIIWCGVCLTKMFIAFRMSMLLDADHVCGFWLVPPVHFKVQRCLQMSEATLLCFSSATNQFQVWTCVCVFTALSLGQAYIVCGDDKGRLWTYHVTDLQKNSFQMGKPILPTEVSSSSKCPLTFLTYLKDCLFFMLVMIITTKLCADMCLFTCWQD